ncbi:hypothetical protein SAMN05444149_102395 [Pseudosulfitobacter pseudonitzschiae]|uniref:Uncharacterized protein n=1 Tax=Pseudosulfitobacter pseudonitzschiae TaxID=1402135 RepID=A0A073JEB2_9RHOB|nr:hypothetical protein [Pseudosulfitobacter pseudonitzschiae]KEJ96037.1 hypothetical protein SUH3_17390 [Pseudosulfitobacter pseudonitzschiae]SHE95042.1 hypothetical protein SAMN05444149_102395 [Pseudosulfitobacter pseudonitzschiae]
MFDGIFAWLSGVDGKLSVFVIPLNQPQTGLDWSTIVSGVVGGLATLIAAFCVFLLGNRRERKTREFEEMKAGAANAMSGYFKLAKWCNLIANINLHIDKSYQAATEHGLSSNEAFAFVGPSAGTFAEPERLHASEFSFLLTKENFKIVEDVGLVEDRAINLHHLFQQYSELHLEFQTWLDTILGFSRKLDGPIASDQLPIEYKDRFEYRAAQLNQIIGGIVGGLEEDMAFSIDTTQKFIMAAHERYKPHFPKLDFG